ncbi:MAG TPA: biotin synthase BioB [Syntrophales bacterium]|nr:biotin synthase BioB [Syntrophales bacterium]
MHSREIMRLTGGILSGRKRAITVRDAIKISEMPDDEILLLVSCADRIRRAVKKDRVVLCSIINAKSGRCPENCSFCAQSAHHRTGIENYPLIDPEEMVAAAERMHRSGATRFSFVVSGYAPSGRDMEKICRAAREIRRKTSLTVCASLGVLTRDMANDLKKAGVGVYHHNLETARGYFREVCTTHDYEVDIETVKAAKAAGLRTCCGGIFGLGESWEHRIELAFTLREIDVDGIPINFLNPIPGTPLGGRPLMRPVEALKCIVLFRFVHPDKNIFICGGREKVLGDFQSWLLPAGANGMIVGNYLTTPGRGAGADLNMISDLGLRSESTA